MILIDYNNKRPIYEQVVSGIKRLILNGVLEPDEKLPSVRSLAVELSINPNTIQRAYGELERDGYIYSVKGKGNFVSADGSVMEHEKDKMFEELEGQLRLCKESGITKKEIEVCVQAVFGEVEE